MNPSMLQNRHIQRAIGATAEVFNAVIEEHIRKEAPSDFRRQIIRDTMIFSGFKTYHHLKETAEQVFAPDGRAKTWGEFLQDTQKINEKYNKNWLRAEYQFATAAAQMADKWVDIEAQKERYDLLYSTAGDHLVRPDHAILEGVCLPVNDPAWDTIYPPNGWGCRCTVIQVRKGSRPHSDSSMAIEQMEEMTKGREEIFRFNPGKEKCLFPKKHPYYGKEGSKERENIQKNAKQVISSLTKEEQALKKAQSEAKAAIKETKKNIEPFNGVVFAQGENIITGELIMLRRSLDDIREHAREDIEVQKWLLKYDPLKQIDGLEYAGWGEVRHKTNKDGTLERKHKEAECFTYYKIDISEHTYYINVKVHKNYKKEVIYTIESKMPKDLIEGIPTFLKK